MAGSFRTRFQFLATLDFRDFPFHLLLVKSDQMPSEIAFGQLLTALNNYLTDPDARAEDALSSVEVAWTEYEANFSGG